jgi:hypothetical protein
MMAACMAVLIAPPANSAEAGEIHQKYLAEHWLWPWSPTAVTAKIWRA